MRGARSDTTVKTESAPANDFDLALELLIMDLQFDQLRALVAVIDRGSFEGAARELRVTPSAISQRIKALETGVGRILVQRHKPASATESGEAVLRLARQLALLENDTLAALDESGAQETTSIPIVINADSLAIWVLPALAEISSLHGACFTVYREDEDHSAELLRSGTVLAAITSASAPVQGCLVRPLGRMRYRPMASPTFVKRWFPAGVTKERLAVAPVVMFDRKDDLQDRFLRSHGKTLNPPRSYIPASTEYAKAVELGLGWGMLPEAQSARQESDGRLIAFDPSGHVDVPLYWQQWKLHSPLLTAVADAIERAAVERLD
jgi:LysR family transcriptional regulator (chromosome initiation inhibitor)